MGELSWDGRMGGRGAKKKEEDALVRRVPKLELGWWVLGTLLKRKKAQESTNQDVSHDASWGQPPAVVCSRNRNTLLRFPGMLLWFTTTE